MNQGRIWCVVSPNVGLPLLLGSVAVTSLIVHASVMSHTTWMGNYWQGKAPRVAENSAPASVASANGPAAPAFSITVAPVAGTQGKAETAFVVTVAPNPAATQVATAGPNPATRPPDVVALAKPQ